MKFDAKAAREIAPGKSLYFADAGYPGLQLTAPQSGTWRSWTYRYRQPGTGKLKQVKLGVWPAMDGHKAVAAWVQARDERAAGADPGSKAKAAKQEREQAAQAKQEAAEQTVGWLAEEYISGVVEPNRKPKGAAEVRRMLTRAIVPYRGIPARELTHDQAHQMIRAIAKAPRVAAMTRQELRACWEHGLSRRLVPANVFAGKTIGGRFKAVKRDRKLSDEEAGALLRWWDEPGSHSRTVRDVLELVLRTGMRSGEVCGIHDRELNERKGVLWLDIPAERMKGGKAHSIPLVGRARKLVEARRTADGGWLFPTRSGAAPIAQKVVGVEVYACSGQSDAAAYKSRRVCPVSSWAPHDLRRTARSMLQELRCPFDVGEAIIAHQLPGAAANYSVADLAAAKVEWLTKLGKHLDKLGT